ncbi:MAG TPA: Hint domain-containing protein [Acetobacteraceae bacterium]|nr:Hint domain-containing protein [Acetobacteraceae bacterium]
MSFDDLNVGARLFSVQVLNVAADPGLEIAQNVTLDLSGPLVNLGTVTVDAGAELTAVRVDANNQINVAGVLGIHDFNEGSFAFEGANAGIFLSSARPVWHNISANPVTNFDVGDELMLAGWPYVRSYPTYTATLSGTTLTVIGTSRTGVSHDLFQLTDFVAADDVSAIAANTVTATNPFSGEMQEVLQLTAVCFGAGTRIATERGAVAVEHLRTGDLALTVAGDGPRPIRWIGHRRIDLDAQPRAESLFPIRIRSGALAENVPQRDLLVSPDHCLFADGQLVPAKLLVNGMTIVQDRTVQTVEYYHVELDRHAVLLAEGAPAESYLDTGNRDFFVNSGGPVALHPGLDINDTALRWQDRLCAPLRLHATEIEPIWSQIAARAEALGYSRPTLATTTDPDLRLVAGSRDVRPIARDGAHHTFVLPGGASELRIVSRSGMPVEVNRQADDWRRLGVAVRRIVLRAANERIDIPADHPALIQGWYPVERAGAAIWRWTDGSAVLKLPPLRGIVTVELLLGSPMTYRLEETQAASLVA